MVEKLTCQFISTSLFLAKNKLSLHCSTGAQSFFSFFLYYWVLNSGHHGCEAGTLPLEPFHQSYFVLGNFQIVSRELFVQWALSLDPHFYLLSS
jgi:hypothetical protein